MRINENAEGPAAPGSRTILTLVNLGYDCLQRIRVHLPETLRNLKHKGVSISEIAVTLKRNSGAVRARLKKLGIIE